MGERGGRDLWNYLRVRGEYTTAFDYGKPGEELPPRARRILFCESFSSCCHGTTSACAENTEVTEAWWRGLWNYLRVRGEYIPPPLMFPAMGELPPRARRIPQSRSAGALPSGTTSACAENTLNELGLL